MSHAFLGFPQEEVKGSKVSPPKKEKLNKLHNNFTKDLNEYEC